MISARILIIEDHAILARQLLRLVKELSLEPVGPVASLAEAEALVETKPPDAVLTDLTLDDGEAWDHVERWRERGIVCVIISGYARPPEETRCTGVPWIQKPFGVEELNAALGEVSA